MRTIDDREREIGAAAEGADPSGESAAARRMWTAAMTLLVLVSGAAIIWVGIALGPPVGRAVTDGTGAVAGAVGDGIGSVADAVTDVGGTWNEWTTALTEEAKRIPQEQLAAQLELDGAQSLLLIATDDDDRGVAFALVTVDLDDEATVLLLPPSLLAILPGYGDFTLAETTVFEGPELAATTIMNLIGVRIDGTIQLEPRRLEDVLGGDVLIDLPAPLVIAEGDSEKSLARAGVSLWPATMAEPLLVTQGTDDELTWIRRQGAIWEAVFNRMADNPAVSERLAEDSTAPIDATTGLLARIAADDGRIVSVLPVTRVSIGNSAERFTLSPNAEGSFVQQRFSHLDLRPGEVRPRVELLNGNGRIGTTAVIAERLILRGFRVMLTDNADRFDFETTQVIAHGRDNRPFADEVLAVLGTGELLLELRAPSGVVDVSIIVGVDIPVGEG